MKFTLSWLMGRLETEASLDDIAETMIAVAPVASIQAVRNDALASIAGPVNAARARGVESI